MHGLHAIVITPFNQRGEVDFDSLERLIAFNISSGAKGLTALGVAAETHKLSNEEKEAVSSFVFDQVGGSLPITVGASAETTEQAIASACHAKDLGASAVMVAPPKNWSYGDSMISHYSEIAEVAQLPIVLQDYFEVTRVRLSPENLADICDKVNLVSSIKLESEPTAERIKRTKSLLNRQVSILGGIGGINLFDELVSGADGVMTGFAYPEALVEVLDAWKRQDVQEAQRVFAKYEPVIAFEGQPGIGLAIRKEILCRRGIISSSILRDEPPLDSKTEAALSLLLENIPPPS